MLECGVAYHLPGAVKDSTSTLQYDRQRLNEREITRCLREQLEDTPYALGREKVLAEFPPVLPEQSVTVCRLLQHRSTSSSGIEMSDDSGCRAR